MKKLLAVALLTGATLLVPVQASATYIPHPVYQRVQNMSAYDTFVFGQGWLIVLISML